MVEMIGLLLVLHAVPLVVTMDNSDVTSGHRYDRVDPPVVLPGRQAGFRSLGRPDTSEDTPPNGPKPAKRQRPRTHQKGRHQKYLRIEAFFWTKSWA